MLHRIIGPRPSWASFVCHDGPRQAKMVWRSPGTFRATLTARNKHPSPQGRHMHANPLWHCPSVGVSSNSAKGMLRLFSDKIPDSAKNLWGVPNVLLQKFPAEEFTVTTKLIFTPNTKLENEKAGLTIMGFSYANLALKSKKDGIYLIYTVCKDAEKGKTEVEKELQKVTDATVYFRAKVSKGAKCRFSYSFDGNNFTETGDEFQAEVGRWIGAKVGLFCTRTTNINDAGFADVDWFRVE